MQDILDMTEHLSSEQLAAYIDGTLAHAERREAAAHLAECSDCRRDVVETRAVVPIAPRLSRLSQALGLAVAVAVVVLFVWPAQRVTPDQGPPPHSVRAAFDDQLRLTALEPIDQSFYWHSAGPDANYLFTIQDSTGQMLFTASLTDTTVTLPDSVRLQAGARYFWSADARLADGRSGRTGARGFVAH